MFCLKGVNLLQHFVESESAYLPMEEGQVVALMVNNLGSMSKMELHIVARAAIKYLTTEAKVSSCACLWGLS